MLQEWEAEASACWPIHKELLTESRGLPHTGGTSCWAWHVPVLMPSTGEALVPLNETRLQ